MNIVHGTSIKGITKEELLVKEIAVPISTSEQEQISSLFRRIDNLITLHQCKQNLSIDFREICATLSLPKRQNLGVLFTFCNDTEVIHGKK